MSNNNPETKTAQADAPIGQVQQMQIALQNNANYIVQLHHNIDWLQGQQQAQQQEIQQLRNKLQDEENYHRGRERNLMQALQTY
jgi:hypothetical protein